MASKSELEEKTFEELADMATEQKIKGRSYMSKSDLVDALADSDEESDEEPKAKKKSKKSASGSFGRLTTNGPSTTTNDSSIELLKEAAALLGRPAYNGHRRGCPAATSTDEVCVCKARESQELARRIRSHIE